MKFNPMTEEEIEKTYGLLQPGTYDFEVAFAEDCVSQTSGNDYIKLKLRVWDDFGQDKIIFSNLTYGYLKTLKHFCDISNLEDAYLSGNLEAKDCIGKCGKAQIGIEIGKKKADGSFYKDKNTVVDFLKSAPVAQKQKQVIDDEIPF